MSFALGKKSPKMSSSMAISEFGVYTYQAVRALIERNNCCGHRNGQRDDALRRPVKLKRSAC